MFTYSRERRRAVIGAIALALGGLAPMVTGLTGIYQLLTRGYFLAKTGGTVSGPTAWIACGIFILAGLGMMALARWQYRRSTRRATARSGHGKRMG